MVSFVRLAIVTLAALLGLTSAHPIEARAIGDGAEGRILTVPRPRQIVAYSPGGRVHEVLFRAGDGQLIGPAVTPDGRRIAFILRRSPRPVGGQGSRKLAVRDEVWVMRGNGTGAHPIVTFVRKRRGNKWVYPPSGEPGAHRGLESIDISTDGSRLLIARGGKCLYVLDADGDALRHVGVEGATATGYVGSDVTGPQFSPDGKTIIAHFETATREGIGTIPVSGGRVRLFRTRRHALAGTFSDDGRWIAFAAIGSPPKAHPNQEGRTSIWVMRSDGSQVRQVATKRGLNFGNPDFSPDGSQIVFGSMKGARVIGKESAAIYVVDVGGGPLKRVTRGVVRFFHDNPEWVLL